MPIGHFNVHHKNLAKRLLMAEKRADPSACPNFYLAPTIGQTVNSLDPLTITWNSTCLDVQAIDIYLYSPGASLPRIHVWEHVDLSRGTYNATLMPRWWNSTASQSLQVSIVPAGQPPFLSQFPGGPVFTATYTAPASGTPASADTSIVSSGITQVDNLSNANKSISPGKKAAAVILSLLFVVICIAVYIKVKRNRGKDKRRRWTEAVDKRMSTISADWKSVSAAGAQAAIRNSIAVGNRSSSFSFGAIRPPSTFDSEDEKRSISQMRTGVGLRNPVTTERVSRVSFAPDTRVSRSSIADPRVSFAPDTRVSRSSIADPRVSRSSIADPRPSGESRRTRAFHTGYVPPVPALPDNSDSGSLSPRQSEGPLTLTPDDIRARIASTNELEEFLPALRMMRTGSDPLKPDDLLLKIPDPPVAAHTASPIVSSMPMEPIPANVMSPDEMLRAYAERKKSISSVTPPSSSSSLSFPKAIAKKVSLRSKHKRTGSNTMRSLYNATTGSLSSTDGTYGGMRRSGALSEYSISEENHAGMGTHPYGYHLNHVIAEDEGDVSVAGRGTGAGPLYIAHAT